MSLHTLKILEDSVLLSISSSPKSIHCSLKNPNDQACLHLRSTLSPTQIINAQHGYKKGKSTETGLQWLISKIEKPIFQKEYALVALLDIEGAFNNDLVTGL